MAQNISNIVLLEHQLIIERKKFKRGRDDIVLNKIGRHTIFDDHLIRKVKDMAIGSWLHDL